ncbi:MAG: HigA family addiction module antidote protein [Desulfobacterales bacterium]|nr:HigA family addiction module antidote protein [Desulfobacterales bacterium]
MATTTLNQYTPDYAIHPGEILEETLEARGITRTAFAERTGLSLKTVSQIIHGKAPVTPETAIHFERVLGVSANIWNNLNAYYRLHVAKIADRRMLENKKEWAKKFPLTDLAKRGFIRRRQNLAETVEELLDFFGVASVEAWKVQFKRIAVSYRKSPTFTSSKESVSAWLRIGEIEAENIKTSPFDKNTFKNALQEIRFLTWEDPEVFEPRMKEFCRNSGVALVFIAELPKTRLSGATRWLSPDKALIMLSLRYKRDDHFWFTFFHEAGHIILHGKTSVFIDEVDMGINKAEEAANRFAANTLIPESKYKTFAAKRQFYKGDIVAFAQSIDICPGIVVGRLQRDGHIQHKWHNDLTRKFRLKEIAN